jgi:hypothetical protein
VPPNLVATCTLFRSALVAVSLSIIYKTVSTAIGARRSEWFDTTFELRDVIAF